LTTLDVILDFVRSLPLPVRLLDDVPDPVFAGMKVARGEILLAPAQIENPGDVLHEAGHLAIVAAADRPRFPEECKPTGGQELAALAWSYAAAVHLALPPEVVFHPAAYKGESPALLETFADGRWVGVHYLVWRKLTEPALYPSMRRWLLE